MDLNWTLIVVIGSCLKALAQDGALYVAEMSPTERCKGTVLRGPCTDWVHKWYFNQTIQACKTFVYGGCKGENVFHTETECLHYCIGGEHTLPPYLQPQRTTSSKRPYFSRISTPTPRPPVPYAERGPELTFPHSGHHQVFTMAKNNAFIQLDGNITTFQLRLCREISFQFRTKLPHGLLVYHSIKDRPEGLNPYALYVIVEKGQLKVVHVFGKHSTSVIVGEGLNRDKWHSVTVTIDTNSLKLRARVDGQSNEMRIQGLHRNKHYGVTTDLSSVVLIGGLSPEEKLHGVKYIIESFVGCIRDVVLSAGRNVSDLTPITPLIATKHDNVQEGCIDKCRTRENLCFVGSMCINHYNHLTCDCFGTHYEGEQCDIYTATILTLRGSSYVSYRVYDWKDRVHSSVNRISLQFKTHFDDSALFYASGESPNHHHIAISLVNRSVLVDVDLGGGSLMARMGGAPVTDSHWHNLTLVHRSYNVSVYLDDKYRLLRLPGTSKHLYIDPEIYIGGGPELDKKAGLRSFNNFVGSLKYVFYNDVSILYELNKTNPKVHYIGVLEPAFEEENITVIPMTFPFPSSHFWWRRSALYDSLSLTFEFKSSRNVAVLASSEVKLHNSTGIWELRLVNDELRFEMIPELNKNITNTITIKLESKGNWHTVELLCNKGDVSLTINDKYVKRQHFNSEIRLADIVRIGSTNAGKSNVGLVGCLRGVVIDGEEIEPRYVVRTNQTRGQVSLDNCQLVDPCKRPNACEHGGKCSVREDRLYCDCMGTGYIGKNCHFAKFRKTCEELALLGYTKPDVYLIDIDGNGKFPPAHVKCEFQSLEDSTKTIVEHNLPSQVDVRKVAVGDFSYTISYREFTSEMLQELISHSLYCSQYIKYDCYKAPLELHSATWFVAAANNGTVDYLGNVKRGSCPCAENRTCVNPDHSCNCDISEDKWLSDEGYYISPNSLGITQMVFLQQADLQDDAIGRITLGPLECVETNTQKYVVTFTTSQSYIEVPGWRKGDIAFSFRTTGEKAILLYQPPIRPHHPSFMVALTSDFQLTFNFTLNTGKSRELEIKSQRKLNSGEWQKIWIDYNEHHVRFMINTDYQMVDLLPEEEFGPFEGSMFIGGAAEDLLEKRSVRQGLIGCFRGLVVNGEILDIYSYMSVHLSEIIKDCKPSCDPNPCKNGARCKELWSTFLCVCENPWAYIGTYCEININENGMTQVLRDRHFKRNLLASSDENEKTLFRGFLNETFLVNIRTYDSYSLVLHANDHLNNFVQLYIHNESAVVFLFNSGDTIYNVTVGYPGLNSGISVQIAVVRLENMTVLHVNERNAIVMASVNLLTNYSDKPWTNPENEVLRPQRPPAPPTEYFQVSLGGFDSLLSGPNEEPLQGYIGCIRGLKIGDQVVNLTNYITSAVNTSETEGMIAGCRMKCDEQPCKNQGICIEDFLKGVASCNCELTSYEGEFCNEERGAGFSGESVLQRKFDLEGPVNQIKVQLAFSSSDTRQRNTALLLLQTENKRSYYLIVALSSEGELIFEEEREGGGSNAFGARIKDRYFLNGARHSLYYKRTNDSAVLLIDREEVPLSPIQVLSLSDMPEGHPGANEVQVGGLNTSDPRFAAYMSYGGCLSNVLLEVNTYSMKPLEEYMAFTKTGGTDVYVKNSLGVRSAQCAFFDAVNKPRAGPSLNISFGQEQQIWAEDAPARIPYKSLYSDSSTKEEGTGRVLFIIATSIFCIVVTGTLYHVYRTHVAYKRRKEAETTMLWRSQQIQYQEPPIPISPPIAKAVRSRSVCEGSLYQQHLQQNGRPAVMAPESSSSSSSSLLRPAIKLTRSKSDDSMKSSAQNGTDLKPVYKSSPSTPAPVVRFRIPSEEPPRENGIPLEKLNLEDEERTKLLKPQPVTLGDKEVCELSGSKPNLDVLSLTINEDDIGEREEEREMMQSRLRPHSLVDFGNAEKTEQADPNLISINSSMASISSAGSESTSRRHRIFGKLLPPIFLGEGRRNYANPINYLIGRRSSWSVAKSKESVLSLD
ncbi:axotactin isoform X3 [Rhodnius prolixus]|uniref:axotactin isoform X3 n=1 Tax=Rhodnius prolixus TaxID=13249 RepID=UPI003D18BBA2